MPHADVYAAGLVEAFRLTGETVAEFAIEKTEMRSKHYLVHAIKAVYPEANIPDVCAAISVPGKPGFFYRSSVRFVLGHFANRKPVHWWDEVMFAQVHAAVEEARDRLEPPPRLAPSVPPLSAPGAKRITPKAVLRPSSSPPIAAERPAGRLKTRLDAVAQSVSRSPTRPDGADWLTERAIDRAKSRDLLAEAAANTRKLQESMPKEDDGD